MFSTRIPKSTNNLRHAKAAAPAPDVTNFTSLISLLTIFKPFVMAAPTTIAVPC